MEIPIWHVPNKRIGSSKARASPSLVVLQCNLVASLWSWSSNTVVVRGRGFVSSYFMLRVSLFPLSIVSFSMSLLFFVCSFPLLPLALDVSVLGGSDTGAQGCACRRIRAALFS